ncbi:hypothetical protein AQUCO_01100246v1 [Aquilegia coerulea]|uniref:Rad21/Rec8-like protein C-terminal eukaryotic domain-containing protein n=1 Tax=Aquilegia coerulea TaxID=218851 RepID=A0A2G5E676_AQUCA|nr:hypothetical protein AQUCO_01100246v1 [Aquilegia coerulea]
MDVYRAHVPTGSEASIEKLQGIQLSREDSVDCGGSCEDDESVELASQNEEVDRQAKRIFKEGDAIANTDTPSHVPTGSEASIEKFLGNQVPTEEFIDCGRSCGDDESVELPTQNKKVHRQAKPINFLDTTPPDPEELGTFKEGEPHLAYTDTPPESGIPYDTAANISELVIRTPSKMEPLQFARKRKRPLDNAVILTNEVIIQGLNDSRRLVARRKIAPKTTLGAWKRYKLPKLCQNFAEALIPCAQQQKTLLYRRNFATPEPSFEASEIPTNLVEDTIDKEIPPTDSVDIEVPMTSVPSHHSESNTMDHSPCRSFESPTTSCHTAISDGESSLSETEAQDIGLNLTDEELNLDEEESTENQHGWSIRTMKVAGFLRKSFLNQKECGNTEALNLKPVLDGKTRKESARLFYETLVLKSHGVVDVKQDAPYDDICILSTPKLMTSV